MWPRTDKGFICILMHIRTILQTFNSICVFWNKKDFKAIILFFANVYSIGIKYFYSYQICKVFVSLIAAEMAWILLAICSFTCIALQGRSKLLSVSLSNYRRRNPRRIWKTNIELFVYTNETLSKSITLA